MLGKQAGILAFKEAMKKANPVLKEPIMHVEVTTPEQNVGDVVGEIADGLVDQVGDPQRSVVPPIDSADRH